MKIFSLDFIPKVRSSEIVLQEALTTSPYLSAKLRSLSHELVLIFDDKIDKEIIQNLLKSCPFVFSMGISCSEASKSRHSQSVIEERLLQHKIGKQAALVALGGGMLSDLVGSVAATYMRGITFIILPTTLLSMVDAAIGGKTALNSERYKNCFGSFHPASLVAIDPAFLRTLPTKEWISGMAEVIKYGLIASYPLLEKLHLAIESHAQHDQAFLLSIITGSIEVKTEIVQQDPEEKNKRRILNFGHTIGHAIEVLCHFSITHGEAVALGICIESYVSYSRGHLRSEDLEKIVSLFRSYGFSLSLPPSITLNQLIEVMAMDKKALKDRPRFVILKKLGEASFCDGNYVDSVSYEEIQNALHWFVSQTETTHALAFC